MLAILYIISTVASFLTPIFEDHEEYHKSTISFAIAIISAFIFSIPIIKEITSDLYNPYFGSVFALLSLVFWNYAFLTNNGSYCLSYICAAFLGSLVICFLLSNIYFSNNLVYCNENHDYSEQVFIVTTYNGLDSGEPIFGDEFTVGTYIKPNTNVRIYKYFYQNENGQIVSKKIYSSKTQITYIDANAEPYIEINCSIDCAGYREKSKIHTFNSYTYQYHLYIPENSIANIPPESY